MWRSEAVKSPRDAGLRFGDLCLAQRILKLEDQTGKVFWRPLPQTGQSGFGSTANVWGLSTKNARTLHASPQPLLFPRSLPEDSSNVLSFLVSKLSYSEEENHSERNRSLQVP